MARRRLLVLVCIALVLSMIVTGCNNNVAQEEKTEAASQESATAQAQQTQEAEPGAADGFVPLENEIDLVWAMPNSRNAPEGNQLEAHLVEVVKDALNINLDIKLLATDTYKEKINIMITGGEQLDYFMAPDFNVFVDYAYGGGLADITDAYNEFKTDLDWLVKSDSPDDITAEQILQPATIDGRLYGIGLYFKPGTESFLFRKDWLEALGYNQFNDWDTMDADTFYEVAQAMRDGDMNGSEDASNTVAMVSTAGAIYKSQLLNSPFDVQYGKYLARDGEMIYSDVDSNMRDCLEFIAKLYDEGLIHTDAPVMTSSQATELAVQGKLGIYEGWWIGRWQLMKTYKMAEVTPGAEWLEIGAITGTENIGVKGIGGTAGQPLLNQVHAVPKASEYAREAVMLTAFLYNDQEAYRTITYGVPGVHHTYENETITLTEAGQEIAAANWMTQYRKIEHHVVNPNLPGEVSIIDTKFGEYGPDLTNASAHCYYWDLLYGISTQASLEYTSDLNTYRDEVFQKITSAAASIELFDEWVDFWKQNGGEEILAQGTDEYNKRNGTSLTPKSY